VPTPIVSGFRLPQRVVGIEESPSLDVGIDGADALEAIAHKLDGGDTPLADVACGLHQAQRGKAHAACPGLRRANPSAQSDLGE
jgi:hypothetical protein